MVLTHSSDSPAQFLPSSGSHIQEHNLDLNQKSGNNNKQEKDTFKRNTKSKLQNGGSSLSLPAFCWLIYCPRNNVIVILRLIHTPSAVLCLVFCLLFCIYCDTTDIPPPALLCVNNISVTDQVLTFRGPRLQPVLPGMDVLLVQSVPPVNVLGIWEA